MACHCGSYAFSPFPHRNFCSNNRGFKFSSRFRPVQVSLIRRDPYSNTLVSEAARLLGPPASFEASKLKVIFMGEGIKNYSRVIPRTYILSHCDLTANLTLTISSVINLEQLKGWYSKDDVVAEWKRVKEDLFLVVHCYVSGPNLLPDLAAEFRYHIFSKELPLVLKAVLHGDCVLFKEHPELMDALVWVYFHSNSSKYNRMECWGPLKDAKEGRFSDQAQGFLTEDKESSHPPDKWHRPKSILHALFTFLL
ncbi:hypothetical protein SLA2020_088000 [Shorea laevis]